jgi:AcrR family transcriptional regulator
MVGRTDGSRRISRLHRARLISGAVLVADELGYARTTVTRIVARSGVSRGFFYALFADRDECLVSVVEDTVEAIQEELEGLHLGELCWEERVRTGLETILRFLDREPALARVCVVEAARGEPSLVAVQDQTIARLAAAVAVGCPQGNGSEPSPLTAEILVGAVFRAVQARLARREPVMRLLGDLMSMIVLPYLGPDAAQRERERQLPPAASRAPERSDPAATTDGAMMIEPPKIRLTYRTTRVLETIGEYPGATNRAIGQHAGITDPGQISKLLARLQRNALIANSASAEHKWSTNVWALTPQGEALVKGVRRSLPVAAA